MGRDWNMGSGKHRAKCGISYSGRRVSRGHNAGGVYRGRQFGFRVQLSPQGLGRSQERLGCDLVLPILSRVRRRRDEVLALPMHQDRLRYAQQNGLSYVVERCATAGGDASLSSRPNGYACTPHSPRRRRRTPQRRVEKVSSCACFAVTILAGVALPSGSNTNRQKS